MNRLKRVADNNEIAQKLNNIPENEKIALVEKRLKELVSSDDIYDYAIKHNENVSDVDLYDLVDDKNLLQDIWESIQDSYNISEGSNYLELDKSTGPLIQDLIEKADLYKILHDAVQEAESQEETNFEEKDPWNQNDFI